jgi:hypothetical protein
MLVMMIVGVRLVNVRLRVALIHHARLLGRERQERITLGAGEQAAAVFPQEQRDEEKDQPQAEENRNRDYRHAWNE